MALSVGGGLWWSGSERSYCGLIYSERPDQFYLRHEFEWRDVPPDVAAADLRRQIKALKIGDGLTYIVGNPAMWPTDETPGETVAVTFQMFGIPLIKGTKDMRQLWSRMRSWLYFRRLDEAGAVQPPLLTIHPKCRIFIDTAGTLQKSDSDPNVVDESNPERYAAAAVGLYAMSRPMPRPEDPPELPPDAIGHWVNELRAKASET